jgi:uncharacterized protein YndB with AHSA1/START domain
MKVNIQTTNPLTDEAAKAATGKTLTEWYDYLDQWGAREKGRRDTGVHLYQDLKLDAWWSSAINVEYENARGLREKDGRLKGYNICVTKTINAPLEKVFAAWTSGADLDKWFGAGNKAEVKDGGRLENADGNGGEFKRVRANKDIRIAWDGPSAAENSVVDIVFTAKGDNKCGILATHDRIQTRAEADGLREAWGEAFDRLKASLEK